MEEGEGWVRAKASHKERCGKREGERKGEKSEDVAVRP